jgi:hypothetical protein
MVWFANAQVVSVLLATGIAWIAPQFIIAFAAYAIIMIVFVLIVSAFPAIMFWTGGVVVVSMSIGLGALAIFVSTIIRGFVYRIIRRSQAAQEKGERGRNDVLDFMKMMTEMNEYMIPGFNRFFYNTFSVFAGIVWGAIVVGVSWFFYYYETVPGVWAWCFLHIGVAALMAAGVFIVEYIYTERVNFTGQKHLESMARKCALFAIVIQFPLATWLYMMFYMIFHPMAWFVDNESVIVFMAMGAYVIMNVLVVGGTWAYFSNSTGRHRSHHHHYSNLHGASVEVPEMDTSEATFFVMGN